MRIDSLVDAVSTLLAPPSLGEACAVQLPTFANGSSLGSWGVCCALPMPMPPAEEPCVVASVGIGGEWHVEDALAHAGCHVTAFDPTEKLRASHAAHADLPSSHRLRFHYLGLSAPAAGAASAGAASASSAQAARQTTLPYGALSASRLRTLDHLLDVAVAGRVRDTVDVLKIDCEGCEWSVFRWLVEARPTLLSRVRLLMLELHITPAFGLTDGSTLTLLMRHIMCDHGFKIYRRRLNGGFKAHQNQATASLVAAGMPEAPCCVELHFVRPAALLHSSGGGRRGGNATRCDFHSANPMRWLAGYDLGGARFNDDGRLFNSIKLERRHGRAAVQGREASEAKG